MSKYYYNKDYFKKIDNSNKAYWLGFLYADGCITRFYKNEKIRSMTLELTLCNEDREHLNKFLKDIDSNVPIKDKIVNLNNKKYKSVRINVCCTKMCYDLCNLGCVPQKTYTLKMPTNKIVPYEYMRDFIRGYFDGDGCICITNNNSHIELSLTGMSDMLISISDFLISEKVLRVKPKIHKDKRSKASSFYIYGTDSVKEILDYLYKNSDVYLDRKYNKYKEFYKNYNDKIQKRGVYYNKYFNRYIVTISINNKRKCIGSYKTIDEAIKARKEAEIDKMIFLNAR